MLCECIITDKTTYEHSRNFKTQANQISRHIEITKHLRHIPIAVQTNSKLLYK